MESDPSLPPPPKLLIIASVVVIGVCLWVATMSLVAAIHVPDVLVAITNLVLGAPAALLAVEQHLATHHSNPRAAKISQWLLYGFGGVGILVSAMWIALGGLMGSPATLLFLIPAISGVLAFLVGDLNGRWAAKLLSPRWHHLRTRPFQFSIGEVLAITTTLAVCLSVSMWILKSYALYSQSGLP